MRGRVDSGARAIDVANAQPVVFSELGRELIDLTSERLARVRKAPWRPNRAICQKQTFRAAERSAAVRSPGRRRQAVPVGWKTRLRVHRIQAAWLTLSLGTVNTLGEGQESRSVGYDGGVVEDWADRLRVAAARTGGANVTTLGAKSDDGIWTALVVHTIYFFSRGYGRSCVLLHHSPTRSLAFSLTLRFLPCR